MTNHDCGANQQKRMVGWFLAENRINHHAGQRDICPCQRQSLQTVHNRVSPWHAASSAHSDIAYSDLNPTRTPCARGSADPGGCPKWTLAPLLPLKAAIKNRSHDSKGLVAGRRAK